MKKVYFDSAATSQLRNEVIHTMTNVLKTEYGNPSSTHTYGRSSKSLLENCRKEIAKLFNVQASEIIFTSGGTEADNLAIQSCVRNLGVQTIITSKLEHHAVLHTVESLQKKEGVEVLYVNHKEDSSIDIDYFETLLKKCKNKTLVSLMHVNNEIGTLLPIEKIASISKENGALLHSDMVQSIGHFKTDFGKVPIDFAAASAHKFHGPKGVGFAFVRKNSGLKPLIVGGGQERGLRAGTEAVYAIAGMTEALKIAYQNLDDEKQYIASLKEYFKTELTKSINNVTFNGLSGDSEQSTYSILSVNLPIPEDKAQLLVFQLDLKGIACSQGSACQSGSDEGSHVLKQILSPYKLKNPSIRFSFSCFNTKPEIDYVIKTLKEFVEN
ncbi:cysteine desulfurase [Aureisphaera sp. CAU 1614]|uniref:Cysteine desulfurase n=1 Tax=Halomarinibacterium sedimenti TaxID=2857106 RepID=A0A9X1K100_9FLAO|nr:cysteine desulfurase family protein [Halomarinibacterium sedimenti]MBW2938956.1 cysteine desulfurase [Halomarinibacterium sedimenti]